MESIEWKYDINDGYGILTVDIRVKFHDIKEKVFYTSIDNLIRMRLITSKMYSKTIDRQRNILDSRSNVPGYQLLSITSLGVDFVEACIKE